jgi:hypothetical protein
MAISPVLVSLLAKQHRRMQPKARPKAKAGQRPLPIPKDPFAPWSSQLMNQEADRRVQGVIGPQEESIRRRSAAEIAALTQSGIAVADILKAIAPATEGAYATAAQDISGMAGAFTGGMADRMREGQLGGDQFSALQGQGAPGGPDAGSAQNVLQALGGFIPGSSLRSQGAAARAHAEVLPGVQALQTQSDVRARLSQSDEELLELARTRPEMRQKVMDELYQREMDKLQGRLSTRQTRVQERAQDLYEKEFGEDKRSNRADEDLKAANYALAVSKHQLAISKAEAEGRRPDATLSKAYGHIVDADGNPILSGNGKKIPVAKTGKPAAPAKTPWQQHRGQIVGEARELRGNPLENDNVGPASPGQYLARPGAKGKDVHPGRGGFPATTSNPNKAQRDSEYSFREAQDYLMQAYGINRANARKALVAAGWKADGRRPKKRNGKESRPGPG